MPDTIEAMPDPETLATDPSPLGCTGTESCPAEDHLPGCATQPVEPLRPHLPVRTGAVGSVLGDLPVIPAQSETTAIAQLANTLAHANACPSALRGKPNDVFLVLLTARDLGVSLTTAMREFHVIEGKVTLSPKVKLAMVRQSGLGKIWPDPANDHMAATWHGERADMPGVVVSSTFTLADAKRAGLDGKDNWKRHPARMLNWRSVGFLLDDLFAEVGTGLYQPDEIGAVTDADGQPIDVQAVESLPGLRGGKAPDAAPAEVVDPEALALLKARADRVKEHPEAAEMLRAWWKERDLAPIDRLSVAQLRTVAAKLGAVEQAHGLVAEGPGGAPVDRPLSDSTPDPAPTPPEPPEGPQAAPQDVIGTLLAATSPKEGDVAGWLIDIAGELDGRAIRDWFRSAGEASPAGVISDQRRAWALAVHDRLAVASVRALSGFGLSAEACEAVER